MGMTPEELPEDALFPISERRDQNIDHIAGEAQNTKIEPIIDKMASMPQANITEEEFQVLNLKEQVRRVSEEADNLIEDVTEQVANARDSSVSHNSNTSKLENQLIENIKLRLATGKAAASIIESPEIITERYDFESISSLSTFAEKGLEFLPSGIERITDVLNRVGSSVNSVIEGLEVPALVGQGGLLIFQTALLAEAISLRATLEKSKNTNPLKAELIQKQIDDLNEWIEKTGNKITTNGTKFAVKTAAVVPSLIRCIWSAIGIGYVAAQATGIAAYVGQSIKAAYNFYLSSKNRNSHAIFMNKLHEKIFDVPTRGKFVELLKSVVEDKNLGFTAKIEKLKNRGIVLDTDHSWDNQMDFDNLLNELQNPNNNASQLHYKQYFLHGRSSQHAFEDWLDDTIALGSPARENALIMKFGEVVNLENLTVERRKELYNQSLIHARMLSSEEGINPLSTSTLNIEKSTIVEDAEANQAKRIMARNALKALIASKGIQEGDFYAFKNRAALFEFVATVSIATLGITLAILSLVGVGVGSGLLGTPAALLPVLMIGLIGVGLYYLKRKRPHLFATIFSTMPILLGFQKLKLKFYELQKYRAETKRQENWIKSQKLVLSDNDNDIDFKTIENVQTALNSKITELSSKIEALSADVKKLSKEMEEFRALDFISNTQIEPLAEKKDAEVANAKKEIFSFWDDLVEGVMAGGGNLDEETKEYLKYIGISNKNVDKETLKANLRSFFAGDDTDFLRAMNTP